MLQTINSSVLSDRDRCSNMRSAIGLCESRDIFYTKCGLFLSDSSERTRKHLKSTNGLDIFILFWSLTLGTNISNYYIYCISAIPSLFGINQCNYCILLSTGFVCGFQFKLMTYEYLLFFGNSSTSNYLKKVKMISSCKTNIKEYIYCNCNTHWLKTDLNVYAQNIHASV